MALGYTYRGHVDGSSSGATFATSGPIPVVANDVLAVSVVTDSFTGTTAFITVTTSTGWGFTERVDYDEQIGGYCGVFALIVPANASPTITVSVTGAAAGHRWPSFDIWSITGAYLGDPVVQTGTTGFVGNPGSLIFVSNPSISNTLALVAGVDPLHKGAPFVSGDGVTAGTGFSQPSPTGPPGVSGFGTIASWPTPDRSYFVNVDQPGSVSDAFLGAMMEFAPAPAVPTVGAGLDRTVERTKGLIRTPSESSDPRAPITARQWSLQSAPGGASPPVGPLPAYGGDPKRVLLPNSVVGPHVIRYTATNSSGSSFDEATITVTPLRPSVNAGGDQTIALGLFTRTATEVAGDSPTSSRQWYIDSGPAGVGTTIGTAAALSWTPTTLGQYVLRYTATSADGTSDPDYATITVGVVGIPLNIGDGTVRLGIAIAFAGDLTDPDGSSWIFTEVTTDVRVAKGVYLRHGRSDEASASQPASCRFTLDNRDGKYSLGGRSPYWPNVRQGTPVGVYIDTGGGFEAVFIGYADGFTPEYSINPLDTVTGRGDATVEVSASGSMRRLSQGQPPVMSPIRRGLLSAAGVVAYWPCEDGANAQFIASAFPGQPPMEFTRRLHDGSNPNVPATRPKLAASTDFDCSLPLPQLNDSEWYGHFQDYTATSAIQLRLLISIPDSGSNDSAVLVGLITSGDPGFWEIRYKSGGVLNIRAWRKFTTLVIDTDVSGFNLEGRPGQLGIQLSTSGGSVSYWVDFLAVGATGSGGYGSTIASSTVGRALRVQTNTDGGHVGVAIGHIEVRDRLTSDTENIAHLNAYAGEDVGQRLNRVTTENTLNYHQPDGDVHFIAVTDLMGPQRVGTILEILRDCERCDQGILWDGVSPGITYTTKRYRESRDPVLELDVTAGEVAYPFQPVHDDAYRRNRVTCQRTHGASAVFEDTAGPLGSNTIGRYDDSLDVNVASDNSAIYYAGWRVHTGTVEGYRWPRLTLNLRANPHLIDNWVGVIPGDRITVAGLDDVNSSAPVEDITLGVEGFEQVITDSTWGVQINCSPYDQWSVACACDTVGDTREFGARADTDSSTITTLIAAGQTTLSATTPSGPLWTTVADDYPLYLDLGDVRVGAVSCSGTSSPQTFTIEPMPVDRPAGTRIQLWHPPVFGL